MSSADGGKNGKNGEADKVIALLPWDITVRRARTRRHAHELVERKDADEAIRALSEIETYYVVKELGLESSLPVLSVLEPRQICALIDLDVWHDDRASLEDLLLWLSAFREASPAQLARAARSIDPELFALLLQRRLMIALKPREDDEAHHVPAWIDQPPEGILPLIETPDHRFILAARAEVEDDEGRTTPVDEEERKQILELIDLLYKEVDFEFVAGALRLAETDFGSDLEESAYRFKNGRLEDLGFPERTRALEIFAPIDPEAVVEGGDANEPATELMLPALHADALSHGLFREALRAIESPEVVRRIEGELIALANAALVAERVEPGDLDRLRAVLEEMRGYIELALSHRADPARITLIARDRLTQHPMRTLFRAGFALTLELERRARELLRRGAFRAGKEPLSLLADADRVVLEALLAKRPSFARVLEDPKRSLEDVRPFASARDLELARAALGDLESLDRAALALELAAKNAALEGAIDPPLAEERTADMWLTTAAANVIAGRDFLLEPLGHAALEKLRAMLEPPASAGPRRFPREAVDAAVRAAFETIGFGAPAIERRIREGLGALEEALSPLVGSGEIDPRYVGTVVRRL